MKSAARLLPLILAALLSACAGNPKPAPAPERTMLGRPDADLTVQNCFSKVIRIPHRQLTDAEMVDIIARQRREILHKNACGRRLLAWVDDQRRLLGRQ